MKSAAIYVRKSTKHQQCSTSKQMRAIREFAKRRGLEIVKQFGRTNRVEAIKQIRSHAA